MGIKKLIAIVMMFVFTMAPLISNTYADSDNIIMKINGKVFHFQTRYGNPEIYNNKVIVSLKPLVKALGYSLTVKNDIVTIPTIKGDVTLMIGKNTLSTPTQKITMETNVLADDLRKNIFVSPKAIIEALGFKYRYTKPTVKDKNHTIYADGKIGAFAFPKLQYIPQNLSFGNGILSFKQTPVNTYPLLELKPLVEYMEKSYGTLDKDGNKKYAFESADSPLGIKPFQYSPIGGGIVNGTQTIEVLDLTHVGMWEVGILDWEAKDSKDVLYALFKSLAGDKDGQYIIDTFYSEMNNGEITELSNRWIDCKDSSTQFRIINNELNEIISVFLRLNPSSFNEDIKKVYGKGIINGKPTGLEYPLSQCKPFVEYMEANFGERDYQGYKRYYIDHKNSERLASTFQYDPSGGELLSEVNNINVFDCTNNEKGYWEIWIRMFGANERRIIRQLLMALAGDDDGLYIFDKFTEAWESNGKKGILDKWQTAPNGRQFKLETAYAGAHILLK